MRVLNSWEDSRIHSPADYKEWHRKKRKGVKRKERRGCRETASRGGFCVRVVGVAHIPPNQAEMNNLIGWIVARLWHSQGLRVIIKLVLWHCDWISGIAGPPSAARDVSSLLQSCANPAFDYSNLLRHYFRQSSSRLISVRSPNKILSNLRFAQLIFWSSDESVQTSARSLKVGNRGFIWDWQKPRCFSPSLA